MFREKLKKILSIVLITTLVFAQAGPVFAGNGDKVPDEPEVQSERDAPDAPDEPEVQNESDQQDSPEVDNDINDDEVSDNPPATEEQAVPQQSGIQSNGNEGDTSVTTGDGASTGTVVTNANSNIATNDPCCAGGTSVVNDSNGTNSTNTGSATVSDNNTNNQNNSAVVNNGLTGASLSGNNSASSNTGGDSSITTGNANTSGTIITSANTNVAGVSVSEFNIVDNHVGDFILDFGTNCVTGCDGFSGLAQNSNNGANSDNDATISSTQTDTTNQNNNADVNNDLTLTANTGENNTSGNTGGDSSITTGDANISGNVLSFLNNNIAGNVIFGVVNIFGDLVGDIILPESALSAFGCAVCGIPLSLINQSNGVSSDNNLSGTQVSTDIIDQMNVADINNNLIIDAYTGGNSVSGNTGGDQSITTGNADVMAQVLNIANTNLIGGDWWLVIINRAGQWIGQIVGAPAGALFAGSQGTEFTVGENGEITAANIGNGSGSNNDASVNQSSNNNTTQNNNALLNNNVKLSANTGNNTADNNTNGNSSITTGDANVIASLVNYVNNNIVGGRLLVTFVNVFGNWMGDFITPGQQKLATELSVGGSENNQEAGAQGGTGLTSPVNSNTSSNSNGGSQGSGGTQTSNITIAAGTFAQSNFSPAPQSNNSNTQIAGLTFTNPLSLTGSNNDKKVVKFNLAWLLLLLPLVFVPPLIKFMKKLISIINSARERRGYV